MYCPNCGQSFPEGTAFCGICGAPLVKDPRRKKEKKKGSFGKGLFLGLLIMALVLGSVSLVFFFVNRPAASRRGWKTPEAAAEAFFAAAKQGDVEGMLRTFAFEEAEDHLDLDSWFEQGGNLNRKHIVRVPGDSDLLRACNGADHRSEVLLDLQTSYFYLAAPEIYSPACGTISVVDYPPQAVVCETQEDLDALFRAEDIAEQLSTIEVRKIWSFDDVPEKAAKGLERSWKRFNKYYKALLHPEGLKDVFVEFEINGETCYQELVLVCFDGKWYNLSCRGAFGIRLHSCSFQGALVPEKFLETDR